MAHDDIGAKGIRFVDQQTEDYRRRYLDYIERGYADDTASQLAGERAYGLGKTPRTWKETGEEMLRGGGLAGPYAKQQLTDLYRVAQAAGKASGIANDAANAYTRSMSEFVGFLGGEDPEQARSISRMKHDEFLAYMDEVGFRARDIPWEKKRDYEPMPTLTPYDSMSKQMERVEAGRRAAQGPYASVDSITKHMDHLPIEKQAEIREHLSWAEPADRLPHLLLPVPPEDILVESGDDLVDQMPSSGMIRKGEWK